MMYRVFVYGTLRKEGSNHSLLSSSTYIGSGQTEDLFTMYVSGIPYVNPNEKTSTIKGEVYEIDRMTLLGLDMLEGHPEWYYRRLVYITTDKGLVEAYLYFNTTTTRNKVVNGDFMNQKIISYEEENAQFTREGS